MDVALKNPNELELYDMSGNEKEWCMDYPEDYSPEAVTNPYILDKSNLGFHILRGGSISNDHTYAFVWFRDLSGDYDTAGLRLVLQTTDDDLQYY